MKKIVLPLALLTLVTSCTGTPELRKDIRDFISKFSLETAMKQYLSGGYTSTKVENLEAGIKTTVVELEYSRVNDSHPSYHKVTTTTQNETVTVEELSFVENDGQYYISINGELSKSSLKECDNYINKFFYEKTDLDGQYHAKGYYYGDYIKTVAPYLQKYITIDQENELYIMEYAVTTSSTPVEQRYTVNKYGMLVDNHYQDSVTTQDIHVHN